ncbi:hypothetical protein [Chryseobacterium sp. JUb7]|uniref:hypothetical protein n=1 Tax=Chryseobacterium sp. JUb7 TaxID=2940599 RepID=UPI00216A2D2A|nr:hypothetical protein [Chryseobacterium sp. JUb7]MCS3530460.1 putative membrane protein YphA (DoxX/SURF4 family) [Chryseobacterium sp. JUb7]
MITKLRSVPREKYWEYFILVARFLLAVIFILYGSGKLTEHGQFGISAKEMSMPIKDLSLFRVMWYLFDHEPFKSVVGILQIITGLLLLFHRTVILGVFFFIPIAANILLMDISFMPEDLATVFVKRFILYFILCFLILWHERERMKIIWNTMIKEFSLKRKFPVILYLMVPVFAVVLEVSTALPQMIYYFISEPRKSFGFIQQVFNLLF